MNKKILMLACSGLLVVALIAALIFGADWEHTVGISYKSSTDESNVQYRQMLEKTMRDRGIEVITLDAEGDAEKQLEQLRQLAEKDCDVLLVEPVTGIAPKDLTDTLKTLELPAVVTGGQTDRSAEDSLITYLGLDPAYAGTVQAQMIDCLPNSGDVNGDGNVSYVVLQGPEESLDAQMRTDALIFAMSESTPKGHMLAVKRGQWSSDDGKQMCTEVLSDYGIDIEVIFCGGDQITQGAAAAVAESGWVLGTDIYLLGMGSQKQTLELMTTGHLSGTVSLYEAELAGYMSQLLYSKLVGETLPDLSALPALTYTPILPVGQ